MNKRKSNRPHKPYIPRRTRRRTLKETLIDLKNDWDAKRATRPLFTYTIADNIKSNDTYWYDQNGNRWTLELYNRSTIVELSNTLQNCVDCLDCSNCRGCIACVDCDDCINCKGCSYCECCEECVDCWNIADRYQKHGKKED